MAIEIDPTQINHDNLPSVVSTMLVMLDENCKDTKEIKTKIENVCNKVEEHDRYVGMFKFSLCSVWPFVCRHKRAIIVSAAGFSAWLSILDWINRWLQWTFLPPSH